METLRQFRWPTPSPPPWHTLIFIVPRMCAQITRKRRDENIAEMKQIHKNNANEFYSDYKFIYCRYYQRIDKEFSRERCRIEWL